MSTPAKGGEDRPPYEGASPPHLGEDAAKALTYLLRATSARPLTEAEARSRLAGRDVDEASVEAAIAKAKALGVLDDAAFARAWVEDRGRRRGYAAGRLRTELRRRNVADDVIEQALAELDQRDDLAAATELARSRAQHMRADLPPETVARRVASYVARRGYPPALAQRAAISATGLDEHWD